MVISKQDFLKEKLRSNWTILVKYPNNGWAWLFCPDDEHQSASAVYLQFNKGEIVDKEIVSVQPWRFEKAVVGTYSESKWVLENGHKFQTHKDSKIEENGPEGNIFANEDQICVRPSLCDKCQGAAPQQGGQGGQPVPDQTDGGAK